MSCKTHKDFHPFCQNCHAADAEIWKGQKLTIMGEENLKNLKQERDEYREALVWIASPLIQAVYSMESDSAGNAARAVLEKWKK